MARTYEIIVSASLLHIQNTEAIFKYDSAERLRILIHRRKMLRIIVHDLINFVTIYAND